MQGQPTYWCIPSCIIKNHSTVQLRTKPLYLNTIVKIYHRKKTREIIQHVTHNWCLHRHLCILPGSFFFKIDEFIIWITNLNYDVIASRHHVTSWCHIYGDGVCRHYNLWLPFNLQFILRIKIRLHIQLYRKYTNTIYTMDYTVIKFKEYTCMHEITFV